MSTPSKKLQPKPNIYLVGYRGSGKSTVAPLLAQQLGFRSVDTDFLLEQKLGEPIADFFRHAGESKFRELESQVVESVSKQRNQIISLGGGSVLASENRTAIRSTGYVVWLNCSVNVLASRLSKDQKGGAPRPSLTGLGVVEEIQSVLKVREPIYRDIADCILNADDLTPQQITQEIASWWESLQDN